MSRNRRAEVVMLGLVPPPFHGQSIMTKALFDSDLSPVRTVVVEAHFNRDIDKVSAFQAGKVFELLRVIGRCLEERYRTRATVLYYTPGSAKVVPFLKDVILLSAIRPFFRKTLLHYHSGGLVEFLQQRWWARLMGRWVYGRRAWAIALTDQVPVPGLDFGAERAFVIPNGIHDVPENREPLPRPTGELALVFLGNLYREKGILDAIDASISAARALPFRSLRLKVAGGAPDSGVQNEIEGRLAGCPGNLEVSLLGTLDAEAKWALLKEADILLFPSYYGPENFPLVLLEAMACGVPVIATRWRGIPGIVAHGETGLLAEVRDVKALTAAIVTLAEDEALRRRMSQNARVAFDEHYAWPRFIDNIKACFQAAVENGNGSSERKRDRC